MGTEVGIFIYNNTPKSLYNPIKQWIHTTVFNPLCEAQKEITEVK